MSLDFYLNGPPTTVTCECDRCCNTHTREEREELFWRNITHNLGKMASAADVYIALWHPVENGLTKAAQLIGPLKAGLARLKAEPDRFRAFDSPNGWGTYVHFVPFVEACLKACIENPDADVRTST